MEVKVCKNCRRLFQYIYGPELCSDCIKLVSGKSVAAIPEEKRSMLKPLLLEEERKLTEIKEYIQANPTATVSKIAETFGVSARRIFDWIREDRLEFSDASYDAWFTCAKCGIKIKSGVYCINCKPR